MLGGESAFIYATERFLDYRAWPAYVRACANNAVAALCLLWGGLPLPASAELVAFETLGFLSAKSSPEVRGTRLAIFRAENWAQSRALVVVDGDLIAWGPGDAPDDLRNP